MTDEARRGRAALARIAGGAYALNIAAILLAILMTRGGFAAADPATLAASIAAHAPALRWAFALDVVSTAASVVVAALLYRLLRPVDAGASFAAAAFRLSACAVALVGYVLQFAPLTLLGEGRPIGGIAPQTVQAMALLLYRLHGVARRLAVAARGPRPSEGADPVCLGCRGPYQVPTLGIEVQGSAGGRAGPACSSSTEMLSGERTKAMRPSRGGRLMVTPASFSRWQTA